jgi:predicted nucleotidyltransferase
MRHYYFSCKASKTAQANRARSWIRSTRCCGSHCSRSVLTVFAVLSPGSGRRERIEQAREYAAVASIRRYLIVEAASAGVLVLPRHRGEAAFSALSLTGDDIPELPEVGVSAQWSSRMRIWRSTSSTWPGDVVGDSTRGLPRPTNAGNVALERLPDPCYTSGMDRTEAIMKLQAHESELKRLGVWHLFLFGSTARGEARPDSDIDLFFDYERGKFSLFDLMDVKQRTSGILGREADIMTRDSLHKVLRRRIEASSLQIF